MQSEMNYDAELALNDTSLLCHHKLMQALKQKQQEYKSKIDIQSTSIKPYICTACPKQTKVICISLYKEVENLAEHFMNSKPICLDCLINHSEDHKNPQGEYDEYKKCKLQWWKISQDLSQLTSVFHHTYVYLLKGHLAWLYHRVFPNEKNRWLGTSDTQLLADNSHWKNLNLDECPVYDHQTLIYQSIIPPNATLLEYPMVFQGLYSWEKTFTGAEWVWSHTLHGQGL